MSEVGGLMGEVPDAAQPRTSDLQPAQGHSPTQHVSQADHGPVSVALHEGSTLEAADTQRLRENLERRAGDERLRQALARADFVGPQYQLFQDELARYGISVMRGWIYSGRIFQLVAGRGYGLAPNEHELEQLHRSSDVREELAAMTVARALPWFRKNALVEGSWTLEGGASITTFFMGACLPLFANEFRRWRVAEERWRRGHQTEAHNLPPDEPSTGNPADLVASLERVREMLREAAPREQQILALTLDGYSQEEIVEILGEKSVRAVEGVLHRWRTKIKARPQQSEGGGHDGER